MANDATPCGGCGAKSSSERCMGCLHDFGTPDSAWVLKYGPGLNDDWMCDDHGKFGCTRCMNEAQWTKHQGGQHGE